MNSFCIEIERSVKFGGFIGLLWQTPLSLKEAIFALVTELRAILDVSTKQEMIASINLIKEGSLEFSIGLLTDVINNFEAVEFNYTSSGLITFRIAPEQGRLFFMDKDKKRSDISFKDILSANDISFGDKPECKKRPVTGKSAFASPISKAVINPPKSQLSVLLNEIMPKLPLESPTDSPQNFLESPKLLFPETESTGSNDTNVNFIYSQSIHLEEIKTLNPKEIAKSSELTPNSDTRACLQIRLNILENHRSIIESLIKAGGSVNDVKGILDLICN